MNNKIQISKTIQPFNKILEIEGDKSLSIRWALLASQAKGKSKSINLLKSEDVINTLSCLKKLGIKIPNYSHILTVKDASGVKLSKQTGAEVVTPNMATYALSASLGLLGIPVPKSIEGDEPNTLLKWGLSRWKVYQSR